MYGKDHCESYDWINLNCPKLCGHCGTGKYHNDFTWFSDTYLVNLTAHLMPCFTNLTSDILNLSSVKRKLVLAVNIHCMESSWHSHTKRFFLATSDSNGPFQATGRLVAPSQNDSLENSSVQISKYLRVSNK